MDDRAVADSLLYDARADNVAVSHSRQPAESGAVSPRSGGRAATLLKTALFTLVVPGSVTVWIPRWLFPEMRRPLAWPADLGSWLAAGVITAGAAVYGHCAFHFAERGRGTPAPLDPPRHLVVSGLYRYVRNPMYLGVLMVLLGEAWLLDSGVLLRYSGVVFLFFNVFILGYEEPALRRSFGEEYQAYWREVRRWIPRRLPWIPAFKPEE